MGLAPKRSHLAVESVIPCAILKAFSGDVVFDILCEAWISAGFLAASIAAALKRLLSTSFVSHLAPAIPTRIANQLLSCPSKQPGYSDQHLFRHNCPLQTTSAALTFLMGILAV